MERVEAIDCSFTSFCLSLQQTCEHYYEDMETLEFELTDGNTTRKFTLEPWQYTISGNLLERTP